ncbi:MAG: isocitrate/isopropylmalate dehydrogenase family protein [Acidimicrobiia bacterium]|jgi:isocitrate dehydrogenase (NAD+)|nr:isocitrate/isopropylmalate dehydrogenase family protein [Acidimicrobiia bacterium]
MKVTLIPGDGIGPEVSYAMVRVVDAVTGGTIEWEEQLAGSAAVDAGHSPLPAATVQSIRQNRVGIKGPLQTPIGGGWRSVNVSIRQALDLYVSLRPVKSLPGPSKSRYSDVDVVVVRENTEGLYSGREHEAVPGVVEALKIVTRKASERIVRYAFEYARANGRRKVTVSHKVSIMPLSEGLFLQTARAVAEDYPFTEVEYVGLDNLVMELALDPHQFDTIVLGNLDGDVVSDMCAGLVGGLGMVPGANIGRQYALFEAVHGTAPDIAGQGIANPIALILSAELMLRHVGERVAAKRLRAGVERILADGSVLTGDLGGSASTAELTDALLEAL